MKINILQLFSKYGEFYQPYIPPVMDALKEQRGLDIEIIAFKGDKREQKEVAILPNYVVRKILSKIYQIFNKNFHHLNYFEIKALKEKFDIIHIQHSYLYSHVLKLLDLPKSDRPKVVITLRGGDTYIKPWLNKKWQYFYKNYGDKVDAFIVMSEDQKNYLTRWKVPAENIHIISISHGHSFQVDPKVPNKNKLRLVSVFRLCWEKNIVDSLRFVRSLKEKQINFEYDIIGDGPELGLLYYMRDKYNLTNEVNILGKIPNKELKRNLRNYDFILQMSHSEAFPTSILEAQSYGLPALVSNNGGLSEMIKDKWNGIIVDIENFESSIDDTLEVWNSELLYFQMSQNAIECSHQNYSTENEVKKLISLYSILCKD